MSYSLVVPPPLVEGLYHIRQRTGVSIRMQILNAIMKHIEEHERALAVQGVHKLLEAGDEHAHRHNH